MASFLSLSGISFSPAIDVLVASCLMAGIAMWLLIPFYWQLSTGQQLNSLAIDRHPCHAEQIKVIIL